MFEKQKTLAKEFSIKGVGLHTGRYVSVVFKPASVNYGIKFQRMDLADCPVIEADAFLVNDTLRGTSICKDNISIHTIEHAMSSIVGMDLDNVLIELDGDEMPILDGSARIYAENIERIGIVEQDADREYFVVRKKISYCDPKTGSSIVVLPDDEYALNVQISFKSSFLSNQYAFLESIHKYRKEISCARTFVFLSEVEILFKNNLIKGGDLNNAIILVDHKVPQDELDRLAKLFHHDKVEVRPDQKILNNLDLQFDNECARHKLLDIVGDIGLVGKRIKGRIIATKPGHFVNTEFAKLLKKEINKERNEAPFYDPNSLPVMDINEVRKLLPHRYPFLLVDKVVEITPDFIVGIKNVTVNEPYFQGHFPETPVMPGALIIESMAQCGGLFVLHNFKKHYMTYLIKVDNVKFRRFVQPGDTMILKVSLLTEVRRGVARLRGQCFVGDKLCAEGEFMAQMVLKKE
ncbi:MAG: bifunctional UDP-3-O-[3-hydroxymyristoyl] N-acetylglucosamine deacetylase/3-hydroxyacyl-ACP dehydratase [Prolixibacteraceae bacterium]|nr:bifunctional UDP-3-O-[3-hydroxymyristoyl] N-acetylglucosamine deacetylase/3-hydroxyacyl-ACP dehydratase [Prolixibacteraceae bacterium]